MSLATIIMTELLLAYASSTNDNFKGGGRDPVLQWYHRSPACTDMGHCHNIARFALHHQAGRTD